MRKLIFTALSITILASMVLSGCATPTPETIVETVVVEKEGATIVETVIVEVEGETVIETVEVVVEVPVEVYGTELPRNETLYSNGQQWGSVVCWNPYSSNCNNAMALAAQDSSRVIMFETAYAYNMLDGKQYPLLADGDYAWNEELTEITFKIKPAAMWSDGTQVTADDVAYTWEANIKYETNAGVNYKD